MFPLQLQSSQTATSSPVRTLHTLLLGAPRASLLKLASICQQLAEGRALPKLDAHLAVLFDTARNQRAPASYADSSGEDTAVVEESEGGRIPSTSSMPIFSRTPSLREAEEPAVVEQELVQVR